MKLPHRQGSRESRSNWRRWRGYASEHRGESGDAYLLWELKKYPMRLLLCTGCLHRWVAGVEDGSRSAATLAAQVASSAPLPPPSCQILDPPHSHLKCLHPFFPCCGNVQTYTVVVPV